MRSGTSGDRIFVGMMSFEFKLTSRDDHPPQAEPNIHQDPLAV